MNSIARKCTKCKEVKLLSDFKKDKRREGGYSTCCKNCKRQTDKNYRISNIEKIRAYAKNYTKLWSKKHPSPIGRLVEYRNKNVERIKEAIKKWKKEHPERTRQYWRNHYAKTRKSNGTYTDKEWKDLLEQTGYKCLCCKRTDMKLTRDHIVPLHKGGTNTIDNIQPLCKSCNSRKGTKTIDYRSAEVAHGTHSK